MGRHQNGSYLILSFFQTFTTMMRLSRSYKMFLTIQGQNLLYKQGFPQIDRFNNLITQFLSLRPSHLPQHAKCIQTYLQISHFFCLIQTKWVHYSKFVKRKRKKYPRKKTQYINNTTFCNSFSMIRHMVTFYIETYWSKVTGSCPNS